MFTSMEVTRIQTRSFRKIHAVLRTYFLHVHSVGDSLGSRVSSHRHVKNSRSFIRCIWSLSLTDHNFRIHTVPESRPPGDHSPISSHLSSSKNPKHADPPNRQSAHRHRGLEQSPPVPPQKKPTRKPQTRPCISSLQKSRAGGKSCFGPFLLEQGYKRLKRL